MAPLLIGRVQRAGGQARRTRAQPPAPGVQTSFKSVLTLSFSAPPGWEVWTERLDVTRSVGDHLETFCLPQAEVPAGELESGKVIDPWNPKQGRAT